MTFAPGAFRFKHDVGAETEWRKIVKPATGLLQFKHHHAAAWSLRLVA